MAQNRVIGNNNTLPWDIPQDMKFFRDTTKHKIIIMGRKTWDAMGSKPLPDRFNIIITRDSNYVAEGGTVTHSIQEALEKAEAQIAQWSEEVFVIGGAEIYKLALPFTDKIYLTEIDGAYEGDAHFPEFDSNVFKLVKKEPNSGPVNFSFCVYQKVLN